MHLDQSSHRNGSRDVTKAITQIAPNPDPQHHHKLAAAQQRFWVSHQWAYCQQVSFRPSGIRIVAEKFIHDWNCATTPGIRLSSSGKALSYNAFSTYSGTLNPKPKPYEPFTDTEVNLNPKLALNSAWPRAHPEHDAICIMRNEASTKAGDCIPRLRAYGLGVRV